MNKQKKNGGVVSTILLLLGCIMMVFGLLLLQAVPDDLQYVFPAVDMLVNDDGAQNMILTLSEMADSVSFTLRAQDVLIESPFNTALVTVYAIDDCYEAFFHEMLRAGRTISPIDNVQCRPVLLIDEKTAYALFTGGDAVGKTVAIGQTNWTIIGMIDSGRRYGESSAGIAYVPIRSAGELECQTLEARAKTLQVAQVKALLQAWNPGGTFYQLSREKLAAAMPLHWAIFLFTFLLIGYLSRKLIAWGKEREEKYRQKLSVCYAEQLTGWMLAQVGLLLAFAFGILLLSYFLFRFTVQPAYVFTEWVPDNFVSIRSYIERFWAVHRTSAAAVQYFSREINIIALAAWLIRWGIFIGFLGFIARHVVRRYKK